MSILKFNPIYMQRVWGGRRLEESFDRKLPEGKKIGEAWELVDREDAQSVVAEGPLAGLTLRALMEARCSDLLGESWPATKPFPILVKWLDCAERLSLQVHPTAASSSRFGGEPKTENWYVAEASMGASLFAGLKKGVAKEHFEKALSQENLEEFCHRIESKAGDSLLVESGRIHAIGAGNLILEIQQNSDTTYRVYDWGRLGLNGEPRELHVEKAMQCIDFNDFEPMPLTTDDQIGEKPLAECGHFRLRKFNWKAGQSKNLSPARDDAAMVHLLSGSLEAGETKLVAGESCLIPFVEDCVCSAVEDASFLLTDRFTQQSKTPDSH